MQLVLQFAILSLLFGSLSLTHSRLVIDSLFALQVSVRLLVTGLSVGSGLHGRTNWLVTTEHTRVKRTSSVPTVTSASCAPII